MFFCSFLYILQVRCVKRCETCNLYITQGSLFPREGRQASTELLFNSTSSSRSNFVSFRFIQFVVKMSVGFAGRKVLLFIVIDWMSWRSRRIGETLIHFVVCVFEKAKLEFMVHWMRKRNFSSYLLRKAPTSRRTRITRDGRYIIDAFFTIPLRILFAPSAHTFRSSSQDVFPRCEPRRKVNSL